MDCHKLSEDLRRLQAQCNQGRGLSCVGDIIMYLDKGDLHRARLVAINEFDKISGYPVLANYIDREFSIWRVGEAECSLAEDSSTRICRN